MSKTATALKAADQTRSLVSGFGILDSTPQQFREEFPGRKALIIADINTYEIAGKQVEAAFRNENIEIESSVIFPDTHLYAGYSFVEQLVERLKDNDAIPVAVGSGTINDLTKLAAHQCNRPYQCVATAASMDGYTAFGASITRNGAKQTFNCPAPRACITDIGLIAGAPMKMTASGYADLFAKVTAGADWILADVLNIEKIDTRSWNIVQDGLREALSDPAGIQQRRPAAIEKLMEGLILGGFAMQAHKTSRPASGAEHQFSHLWNMEHHTNQGESVSHGFQVAIGTLAITSLYELFLNSPIDQLDIEACCNNWPDREQMKKEINEQFGGTEIYEMACTETLAKHCTPAELKPALTTLKNHWSELKHQLREQLIPFSAIKNSLKTVGAPVEPEEIGLSREKLKQTFIRAYYIRRRFTILDIGFRTQLIDSWLEQLFGKGGIWEIKK